MSRSIKRYNIPGTSVPCCIDDDRRVWCLNEKTGVWVEKKIMSLGVPRTYASVGLPFLVKRQAALIHVLVLEIIKGAPRPKGLICRHLDGDHQNNHPDNLKWGTHQENMDDAVRHGKFVNSDETKRRKSIARTGMKHSPETIEKLVAQRATVEDKKKRAGSCWRRKLSEEQVLKIRILSEKSQDTIARQSVAFAKLFGVSNYSVYRVLRGWTWTHLSSPAVQSK